MTGKNAREFAVELAKTMEITQPEEPPDDIAARAMITRLLAEKRFLILLDNVTEERAILDCLPQGSPCSFLITTRNTDLTKRLRLERADLTLAEPIHLEAFTETEALALFVNVLGADFQEHQRDAYLNLANQVQRLPIALRLALNLMVFPPHWSAERVTTELAEGGAKQIDRGAEEGTDLRTLEVVYDLADPFSPDQNARDILRQMAQCAEGPIPFSFIHRLIGGDRSELEVKLERLRAWSWCTRLDQVPEDPDYLLHALMRQVLRDRETDEAFRDRFLTTVHQAYNQLEETHFTQLDRWIAQAEETIHILADSHDTRLEQWLYQNFYYFCAWRGFGELYLILVERALDVFTEEPRIRAVVFSHQAHILEARGRIDDALALHKKEEAIKLDLGDRAGLAGSYGNQALILKARGRLDDALALHKKEEAIALDLGDRAGLARSYGNQALILKARGRLDDALALLEKVEAICEELGDRTGIAITYWKIGNIMGFQDKPQKQDRLWRQAIAIQKEVGIPCEDWVESLQKLEAESETELEH